MGCCVAHHTKRSKTRSIARETDLLEMPAVCPICNLVFSPSDTHYRLNMHIDNCIRLQPLLVSLSEKGSPEFRRKKADLVKLSYDQKTKYFRKQCGKVRIPWTEDNQIIVVNRNRLIEDSMSQLGELSDNDFHKEFGIHFEGETGQDAGGLFKEWLNAVASDLFSKEKRLFTLADSEGVKYKLDPQSPDGSIPLLKFAGKILAKALFENVPINCPLSAPLYRQIAGMKVQLIDLRELDKDLYESLNFIRNNDVTGVMMGNFTYQGPGGDLGELKPGGAGEVIKEENKREYVKLRKTWEVSLSVKTQLEAFLEGFHAVVSEEMVAYMEPNELELLMCGMPNIEVKEWQEYTEYRGDFYPSHPVVLWFWEVLEKMSQQELSKLLMFCMGTSRLPVEGFRTLKTLRGDSARFTLQPVVFDPLSPYPKAHTCFNRVDLPLYTSQAELKQHLFTALDYSLGFGLE